MGDIHKISEPYLDKLESQHKHPENGAFFLYKYDASETLSLTFMTVTFSILDRSRLILSTLLLRLKSLGEHQTACGIQQTPLLFAVGYQRFLP